MPDVATRNWLSLRTRKHHAPTWVTELVARWSAQDSTNTAARDGTGAAPTNADVIGRMSDLSGNGYYLTSSADGKRPIWYQDGFGLGRASTHREGNTASNYDFFNNTTLALDVFTGTNPSFTVMLLMARRSEIFGSGLSAYVWGVQKSGGSIAGGAGNPFFGTRIENNVMANNRPFLASVYGGDADTSLQGGTITYDDGVLALGYGGCIGVLTRVESGTAISTYWNGHLVSSVVKASKAYTFASGDYVNIGNTFNGTTQTGILSGHWYEAGIWGKALSANERQAWEAYYLGLVGVTYSPATVATPRKLWCIGHSMFLSDNATTAPPPFLLQLENYLPWEYRIAINNQSIGGQQLSAAGATNDQKDCLDLKIATATTVKANDFIIHRGITNDVQEYDTDEATMDAGLATEATNLKAFIVAAMTRTTGNGGGVHVTDPTTGTGSLTDSLTAGQRAVRRYGLSAWPAIAAAVIGRFDRWEISNSYPLLNDGTLILPTEYNSGDGVHLSRTGYDVETAKLASTLRHLIDCNPKSHANLVRWYSGRGQDTTLADAGAMSAIVDLSSTGDNAAQATGANQPTFRIGTITSNYKATIRFDGTDDLASFTRVNLASWTLALANKYDSSGSGHILGDTVSSPAVNVRYLADGTIAIRDASGTIVTFTPRYALLDYDVIVINSNSQCWINGIEASVSGAFTGNLAVDTIGNANVSYYKGELGDVAIYSAVLTKAERNQHGKYFAYKYGKTWDRSGGARA